MRILVFPYELVMCGTVLNAIDLAEALRDHHGHDVTIFEAPAYPAPSLTDGPVARAVLGTGLLLGLFAVLALALGTVLRRTAPTIALVVGLVVFPFLIGPFLSLDGEAWLRRLTPSAGLAIQQTRPRFDDYIDPWAGTAVLAAYVDRREHHGGVGEEARAMPLHQGDGGRADAHDQVERAPRVQRPQVFDKSRFGVLVT